MDDTLRFGHFELRPSRRDLRVHGQPVTLGSRAYDLLLALAERRGRLVTKDELLDLVWPGLVVEENNLQVQVSALRKLLGAQVITTVAGRGYRFTAEAEVVADAGRADSAGPDRKEAVEGLGHHLLVADDNKVNRLLLSRSLQLMGHRVSTAVHGRQALDMLRAEPFDLLLLDLEMPELDGFALLEAMAADASLADVPVIITSSVEGVAPVARCIALGADDFLHKPVDATLLAARVSASLERRRMRAQQRELIGRLSALLAPQAAKGAKGAAWPATARRCRAALLVAGPLGLPAAAPDGDAADLVELAEVCRTLLTTSVDDHGGVPVADGGGELVAAFGLGAPAAQEHDAPLAAVRAAIEMVALIDDLNAERAAAGHRPVDLPIGVALGEVTAGPAARPAEVRIVCLGAPIGQARQLAGQAAAGHRIVIDADVAQAVRDQVRLQPLAAQGPYTVTPE